MRRRESRQGALARAAHTGGAAARRCRHCFLVTAGLPTIGLRVPAHPAMQAVLSAVGRPLAAPSANASGSISRTRAEHVERSLSGQIALILDGGGVGAGAEVDDVTATDGGLRLLRPGPIAVDAERRRGPDPSKPRPTRQPLRAGKAAAPRGHLRRAWRIPDRVRTRRRPSEPQPTGDLVEAAARLLALLHEADESGQTGIAAVT